MRSGLFDSVQPLLALSEQRALCTFFSLLLSASLLRCGLKVSSPEPGASSGGRLPEALFLVFRLESKCPKGAKVCKRRISVIIHFQNHYFTFNFCSFLQKTHKCKSIFSLFHFRFRFFSPKRRINVNRVALDMSFIRVFSVYL